MEPKRYYYNGIETNYLIYRDGRIYSESSNSFRSPYVAQNGYLNLILYINGKEIHKGVHQLVAECYIPNLDNKPTINHKDGNKENNWDWNLEWNTQSENNQHAIDNGLRKAPSGLKVHFAKYTEDQVHIACKELERDKLSLKEIEKVSGIPVKSLSDIRSGKIWKDISKHYKFPKDKIIASKIGIDHEINKKLKKLAKKTNKSPKEICKELGIDYSRDIYNVIYFIRYKKKSKGSKKNKVMKVQRPSKTPEPIIEEDIIFGWEREVSRVAPEANAGPV